MTTAEATFKAKVLEVIAAGGTANAAGLGLKSLSGQQTKWRNEAMAGQAPAQIDEPTKPGDAVDCDGTGILVPPAPEKKAKRERKPKAEKATPASKDPATSPTALARTMIARRANDETILAATKEKFGKDSKRPVLFTAADLKRLRARMK